MNRRRDCRYRTVIFIFQVAVLAFLVGCSSPLDYEVSKMTSEERSKLEKILTADQLKKIDDWSYRTAIADKHIPSGTTVEQALQEQAEWLAKQASEDVKAEERRKQVQLARAARQEKLASVLSVTLVSKKNAVQEDGHRLVMIVISYINNTDKDIRAVEGVLKLTDTYENAIMDIGWSYDGGVAARRSAVQHDEGVAIEKDVEPQVKLWNTDFEKLKATFQINALIFNDGTAIKALD